MDVLLELHNEWADLVRDSLPDGEEDDDDEASSSQPGTNKEERFENKFNHWIAPPSYSTPSELEDE